MRPSGSRRNATIALAAAILALLPASAAAKSYSITSVAIDADLRPDGVLSVSERRTFDFDGSFTFAYRDLPGREPEAFDGFRVMEDGRAYQRSGSHQPGSYEVTRESGRTRVTWYFSARDEKRTFELGYLARGAVERYEDAAVLYFKFIGADWDVPQHDVSIFVRPPEALAANAVQVWLHGPLWAYSRLEAGGTIAAFCEHLPARTYLEVRSLYPQEAFPGASARPGSIRAATLAEEAGWAEEANRARESAKRKIERGRRLEAAGKLVVPPLVLAGLLGWWLIFRAFGNRPTVVGLPSMASEIPDRTPPALVGYLLHGRQVYAGSLVATMLDLAERGFIRLRQDTTDARGLLGGARKKQVYTWQVDRDHWQRHGADLADFEDSLLRFIFKEVGKGSDAVTLDQMKKAHGSFTKYFGQWQKMVGNKGKAAGWYDRASIRGMYYSLALGLGLIALTAALAYPFRIWVVPLGATGVTVLILSFLIPHRTAEGETKARQWRAVGKYLRAYQFRNQSGQDFLGRISRYLVYGAVLGLSPKAYGELAGLVPEAQRGTYLYWYVPGGGGLAPDAFGAAFSSMVATATSSMSSASGAGGGASGGGGGGAGGGGGGAG